DDLKTALDAGSVKKALDAATALSLQKRPKSYRDKGVKALADLDAKGRERLEVARKLVAEGKVEDARPTLETLAADYRGRDVGREAAEALRKAGPPPPK